MAKDYFGCSRTRYEEMVARRTELEKKKQAEKQKKINKRKSINAMIKNLPMEKGYDVFCKSHHRWYSNKGRLSPCKADDNCVLGYKLRYSHTQKSLF